MELLAHPQQLSLPPNPRRQPQPHPGSLFFRRKTEEEERTAEKGGAVTAATVEKNDGGGGALCPTNKFLLQV
ncbi:hypothetical protein Hanom_Chr11g01063611 [Helianthus anomalus]